MLIKTIFSLIKKSAKQIYSSLCALQIFIPIILLSISSNNLFAAPVIKIHTLMAAPIVDGAGNEWQDIPVTEIKLSNSRPDQKSNIDTLLIKGGVFADKVYFYFSWLDQSKNIEHKPFFWSDKKNRYIKSNILEDRIAIQFAMRGDYTTNWLSGNSFTADMWHWKASRSNPLGLAQDKHTIISTSKLLRSYKTTAVNGQLIYILRPNDAGDRLYKSTRYKEKFNDKMPKYILTDNPQGSIADVKAKGVWNEGKWHLEMSRDLNTNQLDDAVFLIDNQILGGVAVFNSTGDDDHNISDTLIFKF